MKTDKVVSYLMMQAYMIMRKLILRKRIKSIKSLNEFKKKRVDIWTRKIKCEKLIETN